MANLVIWVAVLLTVSCVSQAANITVDIVTDVKCTRNDSIVTLDLTGITDRPNYVSINGIPGCSQWIDNTTDVTTVFVAFSECGVNPTPEKTTQFNLYIVESVQYVSGGDLFVPFMCSDVNIGSIVQTSDVNEKIEVTKDGENVISLDPTNIKMSFTDSMDKTLTQSVQLGDAINLKVEATDASTVFEVTTCFVESVDETSKRIGPYPIIEAGCTVDTGLLSDITNINGAQSRSSTATVKAFRLVGQARMRSVTFRCDLRWCESDNGACDHSPGNACKPTTTRRRKRRQATAIQRTLTSSLQVDLPGYPSQATGAATVTSIDYTMKMAVLLFCGLRYLL